MARMARIKVDGEAAAYHLYGRVAGLKGEYTLAKPLCRKTLIELIKHYARGYCCRVAALSVMGTHYHLVMQFDGYRQLSPEELRKRALLLYPNSEADLDEWPQAKWNRLQERLFEGSSKGRTLSQGKALTTALRQCKSCRRNEKRYFWLISQLDCSEDALWHAWQESKLMVRLRLIICMGVLQE